MKKIAILLALLALAILGYFWFKNVSYAIYTSKIQPPAVQFKYPKTWKIKRDEGKLESYTQILVNGPRNAADTYSAMFIVRQSPVGERFKSLDELMNHKLSHLFRNATLIAKEDYSIDRHEGRLVELSYVIPPMHLKGLKPLAVDVQAKMIYVQIGKNFYEIIYSADRSEFIKHRPDFENLLSSFRFMGGA